MTQHLLHCQLAFHNMKQLKGHTEQHRETTEKKESKICGSLIESARECINVERTVAHRTVSLVGNRAQSAIISSAASGWPLRPLLLLLPFPRSLFLVAVIAVGPRTKCALTFVWHHARARTTKMTL